MMRACSNSPFDKSSAIWKPHYARLQQRGKAPSKPMMVHWRSRESGFGAGQCSQMHSDRNILLAKMSERKQVQQLPPTSNSNQGLWGCGMIDTGSSNGQQLLMTACAKMVTFAGSRSVATLYWRASNRATSAPDNFIEKRMADLGRQRPEAPIEFRVKIASA